MRNKTWLLLQQSLYEKKIENTKNGNLLLLTSVLVVKTKKAILMCDQAKTFITSSAVVVKTKKAVLMCDQAIWQI